MSENKCQQRAVEKNFAKIFVFLGLSWQKSILMFYFNLSRQETNNISSIALQLTILSMKSGGQHCTQVRCAKRNAL